MAFICLLPTTHPCPTQTAVPSVAVVTNWPIWTMMETLFFFFLILISSCQFPEKNLCYYISSGSFKLVLTALVGQGGLPIVDAMREF